MHRGMHGLNEKIENSKKIFKDLPLKIESIADFKEFILQYLFKDLDLTDENLIAKLEDKHSELFQSLVEEGIKYAGELAVLYDISNKNGWQGIGDVETNEETHQKYFNPDITNLSRLIGDDVITELIAKVKQYLGQ